MKAARFLVRLSYLLAGATNLVCMAFGAAAAPLPTEVSSPLERLYVPGDFDDNDNAELILFGYFPHSCYKTGRTHFKIDHQLKTIDVKAVSFLYSDDGGLCTTAQVPFAQKVQLGILPSGSYHITISGSSMLSAQVSIRKHRVSSPDDFLYAPVDNILLEKNESGTKAVLLGRYPRLASGCMILRKVDLTREQQDIIVLRPIADLLTDEDCHDHLHKRNFAIDVPLPNDLVEKSLVHVRSTNGDSLNKIYLD